MDVWSLGKKDILAIELFIALTNRGCQQHVGEPYTGTRAWHLFLMLVTILIALFYQRVGQSGCVGDPGRSLWGRASTSWRREFGPRLWTYGLASGCRMSPGYLSASRLPSIIASLSKGEAALHHHTT